MSVFKNIRCLTASIMLLTVSLAQITPVMAQSSNSPAPPHTNITDRLEYPETKKINHTDEYHGTKVADPYRWLEDAGSADTRQWITAQNKVTFAYLDKIPEREQIRQRLTKLWNFERYSVPYREGRRYFFSERVWELSFAWPESSKHQVNHRNINPCFR